MKEIAGLLVLLAHFVVVFNANEIRLVSKRPVHLSLRQIVKRDNETRVLNQFRTKPWFFQEALNLKSGEPFEIDLNRWNSVANCGLFANLTAESFLADDGRVGLNISGFEVESRRIAPELSMKASLDKPEVSGGVMLTDRNFRGLGESFQFMSYLKSDSISSKEMSLKPNFKLKWVDNVIGKVLKVSLGASERNTYEHWRNIFPKFLQLRNIGVFMDSVSKIGTRTSISYVGLDGILPLDRLVEDLDGTYGIRPYRKSVEVEAGSVAEGRSDKATFSLFGVKSTLDLVARSGLKLNLWHDGGIVRQASGGSGPSPDYHHMGFSSQSPSFTYPLRVQLQPPVRILTSASDASDQLDSIVCDGVVSAKMKISGMRSWGEGCVPLYHQESMGCRGSDMVRGFTSHDFVDDLNTVSSYGLLQTDVYYDTRTRLGKVGLFSDNAFYSQNGESTPKTVSTAGLSLRVGGFRLDVGNPVHGLLSIPRIHLGVDSGD